MTIERPTCSNFHDSTAVTLVEHAYAFKLNAFKLNA